jgi:hypothetical protein
MHGSPLLRTIIVIIALLAAAVPLWRMTHETAAASVLPVVGSQGAEAQSKVHLAVAFAQKPASFEIDYLGKPVWREDPASAVTAEKELSMNYPKEGVDLEYKVQWPPGTQMTAARLSVAVNDAEPVEKTLWGSGQVDDVLTFPANPPQ